MTILTSMYTPMCVCTYGEPKRKLEDNIKMDFKEVKFEVLD
jgi:hypothetical protein